MITDALDEIVEWLTDLKRNTEGAIDDLHERVDARPTKSDIEKLVADLVPAAFRGRLSFDELAAQVKGNTDNLYLLETRLLELTVSVDNLQRMLARVFARLGSRE